MSPGLPWRAWPGWAAVSVLFLLVLRRMEHYAGYDPDRYYHLALSRMTAERGILHTLPQVASLHWDQYFPDKEFLFHVLSAGAFLVGGEAAVNALPPVLSLVILSLLVSLAARAVPTWTAAALVAGLALMTPHFLDRLLLLRPHLLAILLFLVTLAALRARRPVATAAGAALYALSYHAVYIPLAVFAVAVPFSLRGDRAERRTLAAGLAGLAAGVVVNPYFPSNVLMGLTHLGIALAPAETTAREIGFELLRLSPADYLARFGVLLAVMAAAAAGAWRARARMRTGRTDGPVFLLAVAVLFWGAATSSPRAAEYAIPLTVLLVAEVLGALAARTPQLAAASLLVVALQAIPFGRFVADGMPPSVHARVSLEAARALPPEAAGRFVFNCEWDRAPYLLYARPDVKFVDILDPNLLAAADPELHRARLALNNGLVGDPATLLRDVLGAEWALCESPPAVEQMEADPRFVRLFPGTRPRGKISPHLYALAPGAAAHTAHALELEVRPGEWVGTSNTVDTRTGATSPLLDLRAALPAFTRSGNARDCAVFRVPADVIAAHAGAMLLGLGGGRDMETWLGDEELPAYSHAGPPRVLSRLVPLPRALVPGDVVRGRVCVTAGAPGWSVAVSLWTPEQRERACRGKEDAPGSCPLPGVTTP